MFKTIESRATASLLSSMLAVFALIVLVTAAEDASAATYYVRTDGNDSNSGTASDAANAWATVAGAATKSLVAGDIIYVRVGTYTGSIAPTVDGTLANPIQFIADTDGSVFSTPGNVILQAPVGVHALHLSSDDYLDFVGFQFDGDVGNNAVEIDTCTGAVLEKCVIYGGDVGVNIDGASATIVNCLIRDNAGSGVEMDTSTSSLTIWNSTLVNNGSRGFRHRDGTSTVTNCVIANNTGDGLRFDGGTMTHTYNVVYGNSNNYDGTSAGTGEVNTDPLFVGGGDYRLQSTSPAKDAGTNAGGPPSDDIEGNSRPLDAGYDMGCYEYLAGSTVYYVRTDGSDSNSGTGSTAGEAWATVVYAATQSLNPGDLVYVQAGVYSGTVFVGVDGSSGNPIRFIADTTGSVSGWSAGSITLQASSGGKVLDIDSDDYVEFYGFTLEGDTGDDAVDIDVGQGVVISHCEIYGGNMGIDVGNSASVSIINCLIRDNNNNGIGVDGTAVIWNCTVAGNLSDGIEMDAGTATVTNCIIYGGGDAGLDYNGGTFTHTYNLVFGNVLDYEGTSASTGEISVDPLFASSTNFRLKEESPAIDAGTSAAGTVDDDLVGFARPYGSGWDMGCYEGFCIIGHWKFDETSGTTAADSSGYGNDGTLTNGPNWGTGVIDGGLSFDGSNDYVNVPYSAELSLTGEMGFAAWINTDDVSGGYKNILSTDVPGNGQSNYWFGIQNDELVFGFWASGGFRTVATPSANLQSGKWYHVAATFNDATDVVRLYVDGVEVHTGSITYAPTTETADLWIGHSVDNEYWNGSLDDVRIYCYTLSATEVAELYGLVGHWKMDEGVGITAADSTAFANDATLSGATWTSDCTGKIALEFDGTNDTAATNSNFVPPDAGTVAFWMRGANTPTARGRLFGINGDWEARQETDGSVSFDLGASPFVGNEPFATPVVDNDQRWYHIIAIFDASDDSYSVYVNGALEASGISPVDLVTQAAGILTFGSRTASTEYWEGAMRDFRIYNRPLLSSEISELSGLIAYWKLDETSGTVAADSSPNGYDGALTGSPTWTTAGNIDGALDFESSDGADRIDAGTFDVSGSEISLSAWIRPEDGVNDGRVVIKSDGNGASNQYWGLTAAESNEPDFRIKAGGTWDRVLYAGVITPGKWYHLAGTYDGTTMRLYVNGVEVASKNHSVGGAIDEDSTVPITLGDSPVGNRAYDGRIDDVRVFSRVMCAEEVFGQYKGGRPSGIRILQWVEVR